MSLPTVLRTDADLNMGDSWPEPITRSFCLVTAADDRLETILRLAPEADLIHTCYAPITAEVIAAATRLRGIVKYGAGTDSIDLEAATARGIPVVHCPDYGADTVADHALEAHQRLEEECGRAVQNLLTGKLPPNVKNGAALRAQGTLAASWETGPSHLGQQPDSQVESGTELRESTASLAFEMREKTAGGQQRDATWLAVEGDVNRTPQRSQWQESHNEEATRQWLERDSKAFLHQSLSTPCLTSLAACEGIYLVDEQGRVTYDDGGFMPMQPSAERSRGAIGKTV